MLILIIGISIFCLFACYKITNSVTTTLIYGAYIVLLIITFFVFVLKD